MYQKLKDFLHTECVARNIPRDVELAMLSQAQLESGKLISSKLSRDAFNFWGMKCGSSWHGRRYSVRTIEVINGKEIIVNADFRQYDGVIEGVWGYFDFISMKIYEDAIHSKNATEFIDKICRHWATDPSYKAKWKKLLSQQLLNFDKEERYIVGNDYKIIAPGLAVRIQPTINSQLVGYANLTTDGKKHDVNKNGYLDYGTVVTVKSVLQNDDEIWLLIPSGWICAEIDGDIYVK